MNKKKVYNRFWILIIVLCIVYVSVSILSPDYGVSQASPNPTATSECEQADPDNNECRSLSEGCVPVQERQISKQCPAGEMCCRRVNADTECEQASPSNTCRQKNEYIPHPCEKYEEESDLTCDPLHLGEGVYAQQVCCEVKLQCEQNGFECTDFCPTHLRSFDSLDVLSCQETASKFCCKPATNACEEKGGKCTTGTSCPGTSEKWDDGFCPVGQVCCVENCEVAGGFCLSDQGGGGKNCLSNMIDAGKHNCQGSDVSCCIPNYTCSDTAECLHDLGSPCYDCVNSQCVPSITNIGGVTGSGCVSSTRTTTEDSICELESSRSECLGNSKCIWCEHLDPDKWASASPSPSVSATA